MLPNREEIKKIQPFSELNSINYIFTQSSFICFPQLSLVLLQLA